MPLCEPEAKPLRLLEIEEMPASRSRSRLEDQRCQMCYCANSSGDCTRPVPRGVIWKTGLCAGWTGWARCRFDCAISADDAHICAPANSSCANGGNPIGRRVGSSLSKEACCRSPAIVPHGDALTTYRRRSLVEKGLRNSGLRNSVAPAPDKAYDRVARLRHSPAAPWSFVDAVRDCRRTPWSGVPS